MDATSIQNTLGSLLTGVLRNARSRVRARAWSRWAEGAKTWIQPKVEPPRRPRGIERRRGRTLKHLCGPQPERQIGAWSPTPNPPREYLPSKTQPRELCSWRLFLGLTGCHHRFPLLKEDNSAPTDSSVNCTLSEMGGKGTRSK